MPTPHLHSRTLTYCALASLLLALALLSAQSSLAVTNPPRRNPAPASATPNHPLLSKPAFSPRKQQSVSAAPRPGVPVRPSHTVFTDTTPAQIAQLAAGNVSWADYDNDGRLDFFISGTVSNSEYCKIYHNTGSGFVDVTPADLPQIYVSGFAWGDYDNDGRLDFAFSGVVYTGGHMVPYLRLYHNTGSGFVDVTPTNFMMINGTLAWGDYNNDGRLDLLISGFTYDHAAAVTRIYTNTSHGFVDDGPLNLPQLSGYSLSWVDYDHDGWLDFSICGWVTAQGATDCRIFHNLGGTFEDATPFELRQSEGSIAWADYDNDGLPDFLYIRNYGFDYPVKLYHNTGSGFEASNLTAITDMAEGSATWADYNNDGWPDLIIQGRTYATNSPVTRLLRNTGAGFVDDSFAGLIQSRFGSSAWGDYDNDGRIDLLLTGYPNSKLYRNGAAVINTPPTAPPNLQASNISYNHATLHWDAASDAQTPASGIGYNLRVGTAPGGSDVFNPSADAATGYHHLPAAGNAGTALSITVTLNPSTTYYWSVQAIDTAYAGGPFATEGSFTTAPAPPTATGTPPTTTPTDTATPTNTPVPTATFNPCPDPGRPCLSLNGFTDHSVSLSWSFDPSYYPYWIFGYYVVHRGSVAITLTANSLVDSGLNCSSPYTYSVVANLSDQYSETHLIYSDNVINVTTLPCLTPTITPTFCPIPFDDLGGNVFYGAIAHLYCSGVVNGSGVHTYSPADTATRAQFAKVVVLGFGVQPYTPVAADFSDVPPSHFAYPYVEAGYHAAILIGFDMVTCAVHGATFPCYLPANPITRGELTKLVVAAAHYPIYTPSGQDFADVPPTNTFFVSIESAAHKGVITGYPNYTFRPNNPIRRDEMAQIVFKAVNTP